VEKRSTKALLEKGTYGKVRQVASIEVLKSTALNKSASTTPTRQQLNRYIFNLELQDYEKEGIMWKFI
jgi:uncharacterized protein YpmS